MERKQVRPSRRSHAVPRVLIAALVLAVAFNSLAQAAPPVQQSFNAKGKYSLFAVPGKGTRAFGRAGKISLCTGEIGYIRIYVNRNLDGVDTFIEGGSIYGEVVNKDIVEITDPGEHETQEVYSLPIGDVPYSIFQIRSKSKPGTTEIRFGALRVGDEELFPNTNLLKYTKGTSVEVEVSPCYEAVQSAAGDEWPVKDVCSLERPFVLVGKYIFNVVGGGRIENDAKVMFFVPRRNNIFEGRYAYAAQQVYTSNGYSVPGFQFGSGRYTLELNIVKGQATNLNEVNIELTDDFTACVAGHCTVNPQGYKILLKPLPSGQECKGELP